MIDGEFGIVVPFRYYRHGFHEKHLDYGVNFMNRDSLKIGKESNLHKNLSAKMYVTSTTYEWIVGDLLIGDCDVIRCWLAG